MSKMTQIRNRLILSQKYCNSMSSLLQQNNQFINRNFYDDKVTLYSKSNRGMVKVFVMQLNFYTGPLAGETKLSVRYIIIETPRYRGRAFHIPSIYDQELRNRVLVQLGIWLQDWNRSDVNQSSFFQTGTEWQTGELKHY